MDSKYSELQRSNLNGLPLRVAAVMSSDYAYDTDVVKLPDGSYSFRDSFAVELLRCLEITMNFTTIPIISTSWGHKVNEKWVGMIALLIADEADLGISSIADRPFRRDVVDFNIPTNAIRLAAFFQRPSSTSSYDSLLKPFHSYCWLMLLFLSALMTLTSLVIISLRQKNITKYQNCHNLKFAKSEAASDQNFWNRADCFFWPMTAFSLKGFYKIPTDLPIRVVVIAGNVAGILLYSAYSGTLVSFLSIMTEPIQNLGQLLATDFKFAVIEEPLALKFLSESPDLKDVTIYNRRVTDTSYHSMTEAYERINKGSFVFVTDHATAYESLTTDFSTQDACRIREIEIENGQQLQGTLTQKNSPYKRIIDYQILKTIQSGLVRRWSSIYLKQKPLCDPVSEYEGVELSSTTLAFAILTILGFVVDIFILSLEILYSKHKNKIKLKDFIIKLIN